MTNPFAGGGTSLGTAEATVRVKYESVGAGTATGQLEQLERNVAQAGASFDSLSHKASQSVAAINQATQAHSGFNPQTLTGTGLFDQRALMAQLTAMTALIRQELAPALDLSQHIKIEASARMLADARGAGEAMGRAAAQGYSRGFGSPQLHGAHILPPSGPSGPSGPAGSLPSHASPGGSGSVAQVFVTNWPKGETGHAGGGHAASGGIGEIGGAAAIGRLGAIGAAAGAALAPVGALGYALHGGFERLEGLDSAAIKMKALGYNGAQVSSIMNSALESVNKTRYSLDEAAQTAVQALSAGINPGADLDKYLKTVANSAELAQTSMADMGYIFNQAATQTKFQSDQLQELQTRGVPVLKYLAEEYGVTQQKASEMVSSGAVDFAHFEDAMSKATDGMADKMGGTVQGSIQNFETSIKKLGAALLSPLFGTATGDASNFAGVIQHLQANVDSFTENIKNHQSDIANFFVIGGEAAIDFSHVAIRVAQITGQSFGTMVQAVGMTVEKLGEAANFFGQNKFGNGLVDAGNRLNDFGANTVTGSGKLLEWNRTLDKSWQSLQHYRDGAKNAQAATGDLNQGLKPQAPITFADALDKLEIKADQAGKAIGGTTKEFKEFIGQLVEKGATKELIETVARLHTEFNNGGSAAQQFSDALDQLGDSSVSAEQKAKALDDALKNIGQVPMQDAVVDYDNAVQKILDSAKKLQFGLMEARGNQLVGADGVINTNTANARELIGYLNEIRLKTEQVAVSGEATPQQAWEESHKNMQMVLQDFGIVGDTAEQVINKYLTPEHTFDVNVQMRNAPEVQRTLDVLSNEIDVAQQKADKTGIFNLNVDKDQTKQVQDTLTKLGATVQSYDPLSKNLRLTIPPEKQEQFKSQLQGIFANDPTKLPSALDIKTTQSDIVEKITGGSSVLHIPTVLDIQGVPGAGKNIPGLGLATTGVNSLGTPNQPAPQQNSTQGHAEFGGAGSDKTTSIPGQTDSIRNLVNLSPDKISTLLTQNPDIQKTLQPSISQAMQQGMTFAQAFAQGITDGSDAVKQAIIQLAALAGGGLGNSPALYGPLSGSGWTYNRGQVFTSAYASGISSGSGEVRTAATKVAGSGAEPLDNQVDRFIKDAGDWTHISQTLLSFATQLQQTATQSLTMMNLFKGDNTLAPWNPTPAEGQIGGSFLGNQISGAGATAKPGAAATTSGATVPIIQNPDGTWTSSDPEWAKLMKRESGGNPTIQNKTDINAQRGDPSGGLFQFTGETWRRLGFPGNPKDATPQMQAQAAAKLLQQNPSGSDWGLNLGIGREDPAKLLAGLQNTGSSASAGPAGFSSDSDLLSKVPSGKYLQTQAADLASGIGDCSSAVEDLINMMDGASTAGRQMATGNASKWLSSHGFLPTDKQVPGAFNVGFNDHHMQATLPGGTPFNWGGDDSAANRGIGGSGAFDPAFTQHFYRPVAPTPPQAGGQRPAESSSPATDFPPGVTGPPLPQRRADVDLKSYSFDPSQAQSDSTATPFGFGSAIPGLTKTAPINDGLVDVFHATDDAGALGISREGMRQTGALPDAYFARDLASSQKFGNLYGLDNIMTGRIPEQLLRPDDMTMGSRAKYSDLEGVPFRQLTPEEIAKGSFSSGTTASRVVPESNLLRAGRFAGSLLGPLSMLPFAYDAAQNITSNQRVQGGFATTGDILSGKQTTGGINTSPLQSRIDPNDPNTIFPRGLNAGQMSSPGAQGIPQSTIDLAARSGSPIPGTTPSWMKNGAAGRVPFDATNPALYDPATGTYSNGSGKSQGGSTPVIVTNPDQFPGGKPSTPSILGTKPGEKAIPGLNLATGALERTTPGFRTDTNPNAASAASTDASPFGGDRPNPFATGGGSGAVGGLGGGDGMSMQKIMGVAQSASGIASDVIQTIDATLKAVAATKNATDIAVRGVANTADVNKLVDDFQTYITVAQKGLQTAGDITQTVGAFTQGGGGFGDGGATSAAGQIMSLISQMMGAINTGIDLTQEAYQLTMKYVGRNVQQWLGLSGSSDVRYLLDEETGQMQAYSSDNPMLKTTLNTLDRERGNPKYVGKERANPTNTFNIYQGPGQDPRDTMNDAMFAVKASGQGAFGGDF